MIRAWDIIALSVLEFAGLSGLFGYSELLQNFVEQFWSKAKLCQLLPSLHHGKSHRGQGHSSPSVRWGLCPRSLHLPLITGFLQNVWQGMELFVIILRGVQVAGGEQAVVVSCRNLQDWGCLPFKLENWCFCSEAPSSRPHGPYGLQTDLRNSGRGVPRVPPAGTPSAPRSGGKEPVLAQRRTAPPAAVRRRLSRRPAASAALRTWHLRCFCPSQLDRGCGGQLRWESSSLFCKHRRRSKVVQGCGLEEALWLTQEQELCKFVRP